MNTENKLDETTPQVWACILIGGRSSRMGSPKHLLRAADGRTWLERMVEVVRPQVDGIVLSGSGEVPESLQGLERVADPEGLVGPLAGIVSAMRFKPDVAWLLLACDMPSVSRRAVHWLLEQRKEGWWGAVPALEHGGRVEPLFARYEPECLVIFERFRQEKMLRISAVAGHEKIRVVQVPEDLRRAWLNVNTPEELSGMSAGGSGEDVD